MAERDTEGGREKEGDLGKRRRRGLETEQGEAGTALATITINKPDSLFRGGNPDVCVCVCVSSGHVTCGK